MSEFSEPGDGIARPVAGATGRVADFNSFYRSEFASLAVLAGATAGDRSTGEDIAQEALTRANRRWHEVAVMEKPGAWVRRVAINLALSRRRKLASETRALVRLGSPGTTEQGADAAAFARQGESAVWTAVNQLPPRQRAVVALHYLEDRSVADIAHILECSVTAATSNLYKARTKLALILGERP